MQIELRFFAALREKLGIGAERCEVPPEIATIAQLRAFLVGRGPAWAEALAFEKKIRVALDQRLAKEDAPIHDGAEVAFFPPVTGG
ncbi:MAG: molybdopterin converting factor subunit 1 [Burkholderiaceae bacterium]